MSLRKWPFGRLYYDKKITVYRTIWSSNRWSFKKQKTVIYDKIPCDFWKWTRPTLSESWLSTLTDENIFEVNLPPENTNVLKEDLVEIFYDNNWVDVSNGSYIVTNVLPNQDYTWCLDNIILQIKSTTNANNI